MNQFQPIYIFAQARDNVSIDDAYQIYQQNQQVELKQLVGDGERCALIDKMGQIRNYSPSFLQKALQSAKIKPLHQFDNIAVDIFKKEILLDFATGDKDNSGRLSNVQIVLNLQQVNTQNLDSYINYFYQGFLKFTKSTGRTPIAIEEILTPDFKALLQDVGSNLTGAQAIDEAVQKAKSLPIGKFFLAIALAVIVMVGLIVSALQTLFDKVTS